MCEEGGSCHPSMAGIKVRLQNEDIWQQFHEHTTEMIITKSGRRMFPYLRLEISGLDPEARYFVLLEFNLSNNKRFKFNGAQWTAIGNAEPQLPPSSRLYVHPDSPAVGKHWTSQSILFHKVKLTNHTLDRTGNVVLTSMHKYLPCVHVVMASDVLAVHWSPTVTFTFKETEFVAVTAYQNDKITKLKIDNNPFAKGFRETGQSRLKRKLYHIKEETDKDDYKRVSPTPSTHSQISPVVMTTQADDSGISSVGSVTPPMSDHGEDIIRLNLTNTSLSSLLDHRSSYFQQKYLHQYSPITHHTSWMDLPLPPYPMIPPYCPNLWPYGPFILPPATPQMYPHPLTQSLTLNLSPYLTAFQSNKDTNSTSDSCLIDLSIRKDTAT